MFEPTTESMNSIPRPSEWYREEPFDSTTIAFRTTDGVALKYINTPLDEEYLVPPGESYKVGTLPPEEREVRDMLLVTLLSRRHISVFNFWWSQFIKPTQSYLMCLENFKTLGELCGSSKEYRAAFCRLSKDPNIAPWLRNELTKIIHKTDHT